MADGDLKKTGVQLVAEGSAEFQRAMAGAKGEVANFGRESRDATKETRVLGLSMTDLKSVFQMAGRVVRAVGDAYQATVGELITYATEVRELSSITGQSSEETSRLIQVFGDFEIGTGQITVAMRAMRTEGLSPTIDTLASLSDQYLSLAPGVQRADFLFRTFGRSGADLAPLMDQGSAAIRRRGAAVQDGLVLSQQEIDRAEILRQATDDLNDSKQALANTIALRVTPVMLNQIDAINALLSGEHDLIWTAGQIVSTLFGLGHPAWTQNQQDLINAEGATRTWVLGADSELDRLDRLAIATGGATAEMRLFSDEQLLAAVSADSNSRMLGIEREAIEALRDRDIVITVTTIRREIQEMLRAGQAGARGMAGFQHGGSFVVGGREGPDRNLIQFAATRGERIIVMPPQANPAGPSYTDSHDQRNLSIGQMGADLTNPFVIKRLVQDALFS